VARSSRRRRVGHETARADERWLLTYSDMITLLMALFIVMFSMANVNTSKFHELKTSLSEAFSGQLLPGGTSIAEDGGAASLANPLPELAATPASSQAADAERENEELRRLKQRVDAYASAHGISAQLDARIERRGLVITILTDRLLFDSGQAAIRPPGARLVGSIGGLLRKESKHQVTVEGYTDTVPIAGSTYPTNWELSTARASTVVRTLMGAGVQAQRLTASGRAHLDPVASNASAGGRARNRRVQIVLPRRSSSPTSDAAAPDLGPTEPTIGPQESP
jgi:chemotaxis protein MotB